MTARYEFVTDNFDDPRIEELREKVKRLNADQKELEKRFPWNHYTRWAGYTENGEYVSGKGAIAHHRYYVKLRGRGSRFAPEKIKAYRIAYEQEHGKPYRWSDESIKRTLSQDLPLWMAERVAVYIMQKTTYHKPDWVK